MEKKSNPTSPETKIGVGRYDKDGFDKNGFNQEGYDKDGFDIDGYGRDGWNKDGTEHVDDYDKEQTRMAGEFDDEDLFGYDDDYED